MIKDHYPGSLLLCFVFLFIHFSVASQELKVLQGHIITDSIPASNIHIVNLNLKEGTTSNETGRFYIRVQPNDSILFSSVQFQNRIIRVKQEHFDVGEIQIRLFLATNELDEVRISDLKLSGVLDKDVARIDIFDRTEFGIPYAKKGLTQTERKLYTATTSPGGIPLDLLLNTFNGKIKMLKKVKANDELSASVNNVLDRFGRDFFESELEIPGTEVVNFLFYCAGDRNFSILLASESNLEMIDLFKSKVESFMKWRGIN
ncbi:hypothetical protein [Gramella sp. KN1008]|uniref:hypothetical protein n=1 Tax=Gramella sp. KN1008 TaxID=2529298 RepID=UPI00103FDB88|nr:hypothetical protein [Gramella sp. KN1008]TBW27532.1 hypothetical protein EZJ28_11215 [Gramella sp. KN1008]